MIRWIAPPLVPGQWKELERAEAAEFGRLLAGIEGQVEADWDFELDVLRAMPIASLEGTFLVEAQAQVPAIGMPGIMNFLLAPGVLTLMTGQSAPIHALADLRRIDQEELVRDYVEMFCSLVHADKGRFRIVTDPADVIVARAKVLPEKVRTAIEEGLRIVRREEDNGWTISTTMHYADRLFAAQLTLYDHGDIAMDSDDQIVKSLRLLPEVWHHQFRLPPGTRLQRKRRRA